MEDHDLVDPIEELGAEVVGEQLAYLFLGNLLSLGGITPYLSTQIAGHDYNRVAEVDRASLTVG